MIISLRFRYIFLVLIILLTDLAFTEFVFPEPDDPRALMFYQSVLVLSFPVAVLYFRYFSPTMQRWVLVLVACLALLAIESYAGWGKYMVYPHVFSKLLKLLPVFAVYGYYRRNGMPPMGLIMGILLVGLTANLLLLHPEALSLSAFLDNERGFIVDSTYLLLLLCLYYFNQYVSKGGLLRLGVFFAVLGMIVFLQHRTVWISAGVALTINALLLRRTRGVTLSMQRIMPVFVLPVFLVLVVGGMAALQDPAVIRKFENSIADIQNADKQGTGSWRIRQFESYLPFIVENPVLGMRLKGFELPVQFYEDESGLKVWKDGTGHHFHSWYVDRLFYFGAAGVLLALVVPIIMVVRRLRDPAPLDPNTAALVAYVSSSLLFGFSYDWPIYLYGVYGLMLAAVDPAAVTQAVVARRKPVASPLPSPALPSPIVTAAHVDA